MLDTSNFGAFRGPMARATWAPVSKWSPNDHPNPSHGQRKGFGRSQIFEKIFSRRMSALKPGESSLARAHGERGLTGDTSSSDLGPPRLGSGVHIQRIVDPDPIPHMAASICKEVLTPPRPKTGVPSSGGG